MTDEQIEPGLADKCAEWLSLVDGLTPKGVAKIQKLLSEGLGAEDWGYVSLMLIIEAANAGDASREELGELSLFARGNRVFARIQGKPRPLRDKAGRYCG